MGGSTLSFRVRVAAVLSGVATVGVVFGVTGLQANEPTVEPQTGANWGRTLAPAKAPGASSKGLRALERLGAAIDAGRAAMRRAATSDEGRARRGRSRGEYADLTPGASARLLEERFGAQIASAVPKPQQLPAGARPRFIDDFTAVIDRPGVAADVLVEAALPLRVPKTRRPIDLDLVSTPDGYSARSPLVDVRLPGDLGSEATVGGLRIAPVVAGDGAAASPVAAAGGMLYPEVARDADLLMAPVATGLELAWLLRSAAAPSSLEIRIPLEGGQLVPASDGGVEILGVDGTRGRIMPPYAIDSAGRQVDVTYSVDGDVLAVVVEHDGVDLEYPILVDPVVEDWLGSTQVSSWYHGHGYDGLARWTWLTNQPSNGAYVPRTTCYAVVSCYKPAGTTAPPHGRGLYTYVRPLPWIVGAGAFGEWVYRHPGATTQVSAATLGPSFYRRRSLLGQNPYPFMGIWMNEAEDWTALRSLSGDVSYDFTTLSAGDIQPNSGSNSVAVGVFSPIFTTHLTWRDFAVGGATIALTDPEAPVVDELGQSGPSDWTDAGSFEVAPTASDPGLGVKSFELSVPTETGTAVQTRTHPCSGRGADPCPASWTLPDGALAAFTYSSDDADSGSPGDQAVPEGIRMVSLVARDALGKVSTAATATVKIDRGLPSLSVSGALWDGRQPGAALERGVHGLEIEADDPADGPGPAGARAGVERIAVEVDGVEVDADAGECPAGNCSRSLEWDFDTDSVEPGEHTIEVTATDGAGNIAVESFEVVVATPPPDAPELPNTVAAPFVEATEFLYSGPDPLQTGVAPGTIDPVRAAVVRGKVRDTAGHPIAGAEVTVPGRPDLGSTETRGDGEFYLAVNGGGVLTVRVAKDGHLPVDRRVDVPWQDYVWVADVAMTALDPNDTVIDLSAPMSPVQVARGSAETDSDGTRQATLIFPADTSAEMVMPNGTAVPLDELTVRATEYTVGVGGPDAMPGELPPASEYTYAAEYSADEALAAGAAEVRFSRPVVNYTENFIGFETGTVVPTGYYDRQRSAWVPAPNGRVVEILSESAGKAVLDVTGSGAPASPSELLELGIDDSERETVASLYRPGDTLWRVQMDHFTPWDHNWPKLLPPGANAYLSGWDLSMSDVDVACTSGGSVIECENQTLGEDVPLTGVDFDIHYRSNRVSGYGRARSFDVRLTDGSPPNSLQRVDVTIAVAGRRFLDSYEAAPGLTHAFDWDGRDSFDRAVSGGQQATVTVTYVYDTATFLAPMDTPNAFSRVGSGADTGLDTRRPFSTSQTISTMLGAETVVDGLEGWSFGPHHRYDPRAGVLHEGGGGRRSARNVGQTVERVAGQHGVGAYAGDGIPARDASFNLPWQIAVGEDGSVYVADTADPRIRKIDPDGEITTIAGTGEYRDRADAAGDGGPATEASFWWIGGIDVGSDGSIYVTDLGRVRRIGTDGVITTVAGLETGDDDPSFGGDGGLATDAFFGALEGVAATPDGTVYVADPENDRVRRIGTDGIVTTVAGGGEGTLSGQSSGDGGPATNAGVARPYAVEVASDGALYVAEASGNFDGNRVRRVGVDGIIDTVAGNGGYEQASAYGGAADATTVRASGIALDGDGRLIVATGQRTVDRVEHDGTLTNFGGVNCGSFWSCWPAAPEEEADGALAASTDIGCPGDVDAAPDGTIYFVDWCDLTVSRISRQMPAYDGEGEISIPSSDGQQLYGFDARGRHLRTRDALTGAMRYEFEYDSEGRLAKIEDGDGLQTTIERDGSGAPVAIQAPFGQTTDIDAPAGRLESLTSPANEEVSFTYGSGGLLKSMETAEGHVTTFEYDGDGRLLKDDDPAAGFKQLSRVETVDDSEVTLTTKLERASTYRVERLDNAGVRRSWTNPSGLDSTALIRSDGTTVLDQTDGSVSTSTTGADPRFGAEAPVASESTTATPGGLRRTTEAARSVELEDALDLMSVETSEERLKVNGKLTTSTFDAAQSSFESTTPEGRTSTVTVDSQRRPLSTSIPGLATTTIDRDFAGRVEEVAQGARSSSFHYDASGRVETITDALDREHGFEYDDADRVVKEILPDLREIHFGYDGDGNLTSVTPPSRPAHVFGFTPLGQTDAYTPPDLGVGPQPTTFEWSDDRELTRISRPGGRVVEFDHDAGGRVEEVAHSGGETKYAYDAVTGNLESAEAAGGELTTFAWDGFLPLGETTSGTVAGEVTRTYDDDFRVTSESVDGGQTATFDYDDDGLLVGAGEMALTRDPGNGLISEAEIGAVTTEIDRDGFGDPERVGSFAGPTVLYEEEYERDDLGRIVEKVERRGVTVTTYEYGYDAGGRLETVNKDGLPAATYDYDANGNRVGVDRAGDLPVVALYDDQDRLTDHGSVSYDHDASGQLVSKVDGGDTTTYDYDDLGALRGVVLPNADEIDYSVDAEGRRVAKKVDGVLVQGFLFGRGLGPVAELDGSGDVLSRFVYGTRSNVPEYMVRGGQRYRILIDQLGSPRAVVNASTGVVAQQMDFDEFGRVVQDTNPGFQPFGFAGGLYDSDTGFTRFGARDYDAATGRWTAKDPIGFAGGDTNLYGYVLGDPVNWSDPSGLLGLPSFEDISNFAAGFGDTASFGLTRKIRQWGYVDTVDYCSSAYGAGGYGGAVTVAVLSGNAGLAVARAGTRAFVRVEQRFPRLARLMQPKRAGMGENAGRSQDVVDRVIDLVTGGGGP